MVRESRLMRLLKRVGEGVGAALARSAQAVRKMLAQHRERTAAQRAVFAFIFVALLAAVGLSAGWQLSQSLFFIGDEGVRSGMTRFDDEEAAASPAADQSEAAAVPDGAWASADSGDGAQASAGADGERQAVEPVEAQTVRHEPRMVMAPPVSDRPFHPKVDAYPPDGAAVDEEAGPAVSEASAQPAEPDEVAGPVAMAEEMVWPVAGTVVRPFGWYRHPIFAEWRHASSTALVVDGDDRTVRAILAGRVRDVVNEGGFWRVTIEHAGGLTSEYEGLVAVDVHSYATVATGAPIGLAPDQASGRQIAFALYVNGDPIDPQAYFGDRAAPVLSR